MVKKKNILFICKHNRFRSKVAEAVFNKYNKNSRYKVKSAGIIRGHYPSDKYQVSVAKELGIALAGKPKGISTDLLKWQDIIIVVADDVPSSIFKMIQKKHKKKLIVWNVPDAKTNNKREIRRIIILIRKKVKNFVKKLG